MKQYLTITMISLLAIPSFIVAQSKSKMTEYAASNGKIYHVGDTVKLGRGSDPKGNFMYVQMGGWAKSFTYDPKQGASQYDLDRNYTGFGAVIKKMRTDKLHGLDRVVFIVGLGTISNCELYIEDAIGTCEVADCKNKVDSSSNSGTSISTADELAKYKKLFDQGAISKTEYDAMKKKLLGL